LETQEAEGVVGLLPGRSVVVVVSNEKRRAEDEPDLHAAYSGGESAEG